MVFLLALLIGVVSGLRAMTAPAAVSWAARLGWLDLARHLARLPRLCLHAVDPDGAGARRAGHRSAPDHAEPHGARPVRHAHPHGRALAVRRSAPQAGTRRSGLVAGIIGAVIGTLGGRARSRAAGGGVRQRPPRRVHRGRGGDRRRLLDHGGAAMTHFDAIIIGAGQAGPPLAGRLTEAGMKVALVERKLFGGTCVNTGCMPTKTLVASAYAAHLARRAADYGVVLERRRRRSTWPGQGAGRRRVGQRARRRREVAARHGGLHGHPGPRPVRGAGHDPRRRRAAHRAAHLHQCRRARRRARHARRP